MHNIVYRYTGGNNRLTEIVTTGDFSSSKYEYDAIGNLTRDANEDVNIQWNAAGVRYIYQIGTSTAKEAKKGKVTEGAPSVFEWYSRTALLKCRFFEK